MIFRLFNVQSDFDGFSALTQFYEAAMAEPSREVVIQFSDLARFDPNMCAPFGALLAKLADAYKSIVFDSVAPALQSSLGRNGFLANFGFPPMPEANPTSLPYQRFKLAETKLFDEYLSFHLPGKGLPAMTSEFALLFQQSLFEIFANSSWHSDSKLGVFSCGQFFPLYHRLDLSIADVGVGIPRKVNEAFGVKVSPIAALRWALQESGSFVPIARDIAQQAGVIASLCSRLDHHFAQWNISALLADYATGGFDCNDQLLVETCRKNGLALLTNDTDFTEGGIKVFTTHQRLLAACPP